MDDLKLYAKSKKEMELLIKKVAQFSKDIRMKFGMDKCRTVTIAKRRMEHNDFSTSVNGDGEQEEIMKALYEDDVYKYLGIEQCRRTETKIVKERISKEFTCRINLVCKSGLSGVAIIKAINTFAIPVLTYSFGIVKWSYTDLKTMQRKIRTVLTRHCYHHPKAAVERTVLPRHEGGRGITDITNLHDCQVMKMRRYFHEKKDKCKLIAAIVQADNGLTPIKLREGT